MLNNVTNVNGFSIVKEIKTMISFIGEHVGILIAILIIIGLFIFFTCIYRVADVDKALIITGGKKPIIKVSGGAFVIPIFRKADYFDLCMLTVKADKDEIKTSTAVPIIADWTAQIRPNVNDPDKLRTAIISFKERGNDGIIADVKLTLMGAVRDCVSSMTPEQILKDKEAFKKEVQESVADEMDKMGLELVSLNIQDISDANGYFDSIAKLDSQEKDKAAQIKVAEVTQATREKKAETDKIAAIAEATAEKETKLAEIDAEIAQKEKRKDADMKIAEFKIQTDTAQANAQVAQELQETIRRKEIEERKGQVEVMKQEQANLAAQKRQEVAVTDAETEKKKVTIQAEANADAARRKAQGDADVKVFEANAKVKVAENEAKAIMTVAEANASKTRQEGQAEAYVVQAKLIAEAEGIKAKKLAEAEGERKLAEARAANEKVNFEIESLKIKTEAEVKIAVATAEVMAKIGSNAEFVNIGGGTLQGTGNVLSDTLMSIPALMKAVNVQNNALNGRDVTQEITDLSKAALAGLSNIKKEDAPALPDAGKDK